MYINPFSSYIFKFSSSISSRATEPVGLTCTVFFNLIAVVNVSPYECTLQACALVDPKLACSPAPAVVAISTCPALTNISPGLASDTGILSQYWLGGFKLSSDKALYPKS